MPLSDAAAREIANVRDQNDLKSSTRRSPRSISERKLWVLPNLSAAWILVSFARRRADAKRRSQMDNARPGRPHRRPDTCRVSSRDRDRDRYADRVLLVLMLRG
jgi:hypothetical protein